MAETVSLGADHHYASYTPPTVRSSRQTAALVRDFVHGVVGTA